MRLNSPLSEIKGVGPKSFAYFDAAGLRTAENLINFLSRLYADRLKTRYARDMLAGMIASALLMLLGYAALAGAAFALAKFSIDPLYVFTEWVPEVLVELSSIAKRFWSLNDANAAAVRYVSRSCCVLETGRALLRWGLLALLLGAWMNGLPFFSRRVKMPEINRER